MGKSLGGCRGFFSKLYRFCLLWQVTRWGGCGMINYNWNGILMTSGKKLTMTARLCNERGGYICR